LSLQNSTIYDFRVENNAGTSITCDAGQKGKIIFNTTSNEFMGCDGTNWEQLSP